MPWYKFSANSGYKQDKPKNKYRYFFDVPVDQERLDEMWWDIFGTFTSDMGNIELVETLPKKEHAQQVLRYQQMKMLSKKMLDILDESK